MYMIPVLVATSVRSDFRRGDEWEVCWNRVSGWRAFRLFLKPSLLPQLPRDWIVEDQEIGLLQAKPNAVTSYHPHVPNTPPGQKASFSGPWTIGPLAGRRLLHSKMPVCTPCRFSIILFSLLFLCGFFIVLTSLIIRISSNTFSRIQLE